VSSAPHVLLCFTRGTSLVDWQRNGSLHRELALYRELEQRGLRFSFLTYGGREDLQIARATPELANVEVLCNTGLPREVYYALAPVIHRRAIARCDVIKSNQVRGAPIARRIARGLRRPLVVRAGYLWSLLAESRSVRSLESRRARWTERRVFGAADRVIVTTPELARVACERYGLPPTRVSVVPNYVDEQLFPARPPSAHPAPAQPSSAHPARVVSVGRLHAEKRPLALVEAMAGLDAELWLVGEGPLREALERRARELGVTLRLLGTLPHETLGRVFSECSVFALVSGHEGQPKSLLEAMAAGLPCVGTDVPGIRDVVEHERTGLLCALDPASIHDVLVSLLDQPDKARALGAAARKFVVEGFGLSVAADREAALLHEVCDRGRARA